MATGGSVEMSVYVTIDVVGTTVSGVAVVGGATVVVVVVSGSVVVVVVVLVVVVVVVVAQYCGVFGVQYVAPAGAASAPIEMAATMAAIAAPMIVVRFMV